MLMLCFRLLNARFEMNICRAAAVYLILPRNMRRVILFTFLTVLSFSAPEIASAQCGADGTQPCKTIQNNPATKPPKKPTPKAVIGKPTPKPVAAKPIVKKSPVKTTVEEAYWERIKDSRDKSDFETYLKEYPTGTYAPLARLKISELVKTSKSAVATGTVRRNSMGMELVYIPAGEFMMGLSEPDIDKTLIIQKRYFATSERGWVGDQKPQRRVAFKEGYWMGKYEVTQEQWQSVMGTNVRQQRDKYSKYFGLAGEGANYPMHWVSWDEAKEFVRRLNEKNDGFVYSLPSESEWEYAARGGTSTLYPWGDDLGGTEICKYANINDLSTKPSTDPGRHHFITQCNDGFVKAAPVGALLPNGFGLYDMIGNVEEWCEDKYADYSNLPSDGSANVSRATAPGRVIRGGNFDSFAFMTSASRTSTKEDSRIITRGFRVVARTK